MPSIASLKEKLDRLLERFKAGRRRGLVLTLLAVARLAERGGEITAESVADEGRRIMDERPDVDWGVSREEYTAGLVSGLLRELEEMGVIERVDGAGAARYRLASYSDGDPLSEVYARFGYLIFYGGPAR